MSKETIKLALEALNNLISIGKRTADLQDKAIKALEEALAKQEQGEPVAWMFQHDETGRMSYVSNDGLHNPTMFIEMNPRYALVCPLYTTPQQRKPLSEAAIEGLAKFVAVDDFNYDFARAIEKAHGIKENT